MGNLNERIAKVIDCPVENWSGDLNLMHDLETRLTGAEKNSYAGWLNDSVFANAEEKAEAWLMVQEGTSGYTTRITEV